MSGLTMSRAAAGLLAVSILSLLATVIIAPRRRAGLLLPAAVVVAATVVLLSATSAVVRATAIGVAVGGVVLRWLAVAPGRPTLAAGRVAGLGAGALVAAAPFLQPSAPAAGFRSPVVASLLALGILSLLAVLPLGGWAVGCLETLQGAEVALWALLLAPAMLLTTGAVVPTLPGPVADAFRQLLLVAGLAGAAWSGVHAARAEPGRRYGRILLADLSLGVAVVGAAQPEGEVAALLLLLLHLWVAPVLLNPARVGLVMARRGCWLALSGLPFTPGFWGRLLAVRAVLPASMVALAAGLVAAGLVAVAVLPAVVRSPRPPAGPADPAGRLVAAVLAAAALTLGVVPQGMAHAVFGSS